MSKLRSVQVLRGVAACAVVVFHIFKAEGRPEAGHIGTGGVDLFFVISGFIMATVAADKRPGAFLTDRAWRILPLWFIALAPWFFIQTNGLPSILAGLTFWPIYDNQFVLPPLGVGWTLSFEFLFYFGFALALATRTFVPIAAFAVACAAAFLTNIATLDFVGSPLTLEFLMGVGIARMPRTEKFGLPLIATGICGLIAAPTFVYFWSTEYYAALLRSLLLGVPAALIVYGALSLDRKFNHPAWGGAVLIGNASYSIYLLHLLVIKFVPGFVALPLSIVGGILSFRLIEQPIIRCRRSLLYRPKARERCGAV